MLILGADKTADRRACQLPSDPFWGKVLGGFAAQRACNETLKNQAAEAGAIRPRNVLAYRAPRQTTGRFLPLPAAEDWHQPDNSAAER